MIWPESRYKEQNQYKICSKYFLIKVNDVLKLSCLKFVIKTKKANFGDLLKNMTMPICECPNINLDQSMQ